ncbi:MAG: tRNA-intron lyase [Thermosphaera sp.]
MCRAFLLHNRAVILDYKCANEIYWNGYYGSFLGVVKPREKDINSPLELSLIEATYLLETGRIELIYSNSKLDYNRLYEWSRDRIERFEELYTVYRDLRKKGFIIRRGLKFGCDYLLYRLGPGIDHAPFGVQVYKSGEQIDPIELVRMGRLLHSVRKKLIVAIVDDKGEVYYHIFNWWKP